MKSLKKSVVFLVVLSMILSAVAPVFAATPTDVVGTNYEEQVSKLVTLGVISGYEDGTFKPAQNITRAEFSKIACYVVGVKDAAELSAGTTKFSDVPATHWASGYINLASEKGMLKGYPDGTFKPEANVTYAEAITILVRALGMGPVVEGKGSWPANYLARASAAGVTTSVTEMNATGNATRGVIAQLAWNTLTAEKWGEKEYTTDGVVYGPIGKSLLKEQYSDYSYQNTDLKYVAKEFTDVRVIGTQSTGLTADKLTLKSTKLDAILELDDEDVEDVFTVKVTDAVKAEMNLGSLFGKKVDVLFGKDNKVAYIRAISTDVVEGLVAAADYDKDETKVKVSGKSYAFKTDAVIYMNGTEYDVDTFDTMVNTIDTSTTLVTAVLDSGKIAYMNVFMADTIAYDYDEQVGRVQFMVKEIKSNGEVKDLNGDVVFDTDDVTSDMNYTSIIKNGKPATIEDLKVGDVVTYITNGTNYTVVISDAKVTGKVTKVASASSGNNSELRRDITIDGKVYKMAHDGSVMTTKTGDVDDAKTTAEDNQLSDFFGKEVTLSLNAIGEIELVSAKVSTSATMQVGVVTRELKESGDDYSLKVLTPAGTVTTFTVTGEKYTVLDADSEELDYNKETAETLTEGCIAKGDVVAYDVSSDNKINSEDLFVITGFSVHDGDLQVIHLTTPATEVIGVKDSSKKITLDVEDYDGSYYANSSTTYLNSHYTDAEDDDIEKIDGWKNVVSGDDVEDNSIFDDVDAAYVVLDGEDSNDIATLIVDLDLTDEVDYEGTTASFGIYVADYQETDDNYITLNIAGEEKDFVLSDDYDESFGAGDLVEYKLNGDGEYDVDEDAIAMDRSVFVDLTNEKGSMYVPDEVTGDIYKVSSYDADNRRITFEESGMRVRGDEESSSKSVTIASDAVVYDVTDKANIKKVTMSEVTKGSYVVVDKYDDEEDDFSVVVIFK